MNVVGSRPDGWWRDRQRAMRRLVDGLEALRALTGDEVTVVFDAPLEDPPADAGVGLRSARRAGRDAADEEIARLVAEDADPESLTVVTSDGALADRVRAHGARVAGAGGFRDRVEEARRRRLDGRAPG